MSDVMKELRRRWQAFLNHPFPEGMAGLEVDGICVTTVDSFAAGCISTLFSSGSLDLERVIVLESCLTDLHRVLPSLSGEAADYFSELASLARLALREVKHGI